MFVAFMRWYMFRKFTRLTVLVPCFSAYKKEEVSTIPPAKNESLRSGIWQHTDYIQVVGSLWVSIYTANYLKFEYDNLFIFRDNGRFIVDDSALNCLSANHQRDTKQWALVGDSNPSIINDLDTTKHTINAICTSEMKLSFTASNNVVNELVYTKR